MISHVRALALVVLLCAPAPAAFAEALPSPYALVPSERAQQAVADATDRVFGGREAEPGEFPFQVALLKAQNLSNDPESQYDSQFCGGTLVAPGWVLTAAHCMVDGETRLTADAVTVLTGSTDLLAGRRVAVRAIYVDESYDDFTLDHDAALIELAQPLDIAPVALDDGAGTVSQATVVGWGMDEDGKYPRRLLASELDIVDNAQCNIGIKAIYATDLKAAVREIGQRYAIDDAQSDRIGDEMARSLADPLTGAMLCAGLKTGARDSCYGDSGGPLLAVIDGVPTQLGIVSWGEGPSSADVKCGHQDVYGVYARVAALRDWIQSRIKPNG